MFQSITKKEALAEFFGEFSWILPVWSGSKLLPISLLGKLFFAFVMFFKALRHLVAGQTTTPANPQMGLRECCA